MFRTDLVQAAFFTNSVVSPERRAGPPEDGPLVPGPDRTPTAPHTPGCVSPLILFMSHLWRWDLSVEQRRKSALFQRFKTDGNPQVSKCGKRAAGGQQADSCHWSNLPSLALAPVLTPGPCPPPSGHRYPLLLDLHLILSPALNQIR